MAAAVVYTKPGTAMPKQSGLLKPAALWLNGFCELYNLSVWVFITENKTNCKNNMLDFFNPPPPRENMFPKEERKMFVIHWWQNDLRRS